MNNRLLVIIDPQNDFITGSLLVPNAQSAMDKLALYIKEHCEDYDAIILSQDWHPENHMSFIENGGKWPTHCVSGTEGAEIYAPILDAITEVFLTKNKKLDILHVLKGEDHYIEEYSAFENENNLNALVERCKRYNVEQIDFCGLAGDVCVLNSISSLLDNEFFKDKINVLIEFSPSLDDGSVLKEFVKENNLKSEQG